MPCDNVHTSTHTHTHTYIYIYIVAGLCIHWSACALIATRAHSKKLCFFFEKRKKGLKFVCTCFKMSGSTLVVFIIFNGFTHRRTHTHYSVACGVCVYCIHDSRSIFECVWKFMKIFQVNITSSLHYAVGLGVCVCVCI